jgi:hypothetical protein
MPVPVQLVPKCISYAYWTAIERLCIARYVPVMKIVRLRGGAYGYSGHVTLVNKQLELELCVTYYQEVYKMLICQY